MPQNRRLDQERWRRQRCSPESKISKAENPTESLSTDLDADRIHAEGSTDGDLVDVDLVIVKKSDCTYDLAYVGRRATFTEELGIFQTFLERFHAP